MGYHLLRLTHIEYETNTVGIGYSNGTDFDEVPNLKQDYAFLIRSMYFIIGQFIIYESVLYHIKCVCISYSFDMLLFHDEL